MKRVAKRPIITAITTITALTSFWSVDGQANLPPEPVIPTIQRGNDYALGPHAAEGETQLNPENEWLHFDAEGSPTNRDDGGMIYFDFCETHQAGNVRNKIKIEVMLPYGNQELPLDANESSINGCKGSAHIPFQEAIYSVTIDGPPRQTGDARQQTIEVPYSSIWIAVIGDSYSSGEGAPEATINRTTYWRRGDTRTTELRSIKDYKNKAISLGLFDIANSLKEASNVERLCNRSSKSWAFQTALNIQKTWQTPVDVTLHACSGAAIEDLNSSQVSPSTNISGYSNKIKTQLAALAGQIESRGRKPDIVLMTAGGNDANFGKIVEDCYTQKIIQQILHEFSYEPLFPTVGCLFWGSKADTLPPLYQNLANTLSKLNIKEDRIFISTYPTPAPESHSENPNCLITKSEITLATNEVANPINEHIKTAQQSYNWQLIDNANAFANHGYCSTAPYINGMDDSFKQQGDQFGTFHPNEYGYLAMSQIATNIITNASTLSDGKPTDLKKAIQEGINERANMALEDSKKLVIIKTNKDGSKTSYDFKELNTNSIAISDNTATLDLWDTNTGDDSIFYTILVNGKLYQPGDKIQIDSKSKPIQKATIELIRTKLPNINTYKNKRSAARLPLGKTTFEVTLIEPEKFDALVQMHIVDPNTNHKTQVSLSELMDSKAPKNKAAGGYIGNANIQYTLNTDQVTVSTHRECGRNVEPLSKPFTNLDTEPLLLTQTRHNDMLTQLSFDLLDEQGCWDGPDDLMHGPESVLLRPVIQFGDDVVSATTQLHLGVGADRNDWQSTIDVAVGGFTHAPYVWTGGTSFTCDAGWKDLRYGFETQGYDRNQTPFILPHMFGPVFIFPLNGYLGGWRTTLPNYPGGDARPTYTGNLTGYTCTNSDKQLVSISEDGTPQMDPVVETNVSHNLEVWAVPEPVWSGYGNKGTFIYGTHIEVNGRAIEHELRPQGALPRDRETKVLPNTYRSTQPLKYQGQVALSAERDARLEVYACINSQAKCSPNVDISSEPEDVQRFGYVKVLEIPLTRENFGVTQP